MTDARTPPRTPKIGTLTHRIWAEIGRDPSRTAPEIARAVGTRPPMVRVVAYRYRLRFGQSLRPPFERLRLLPENRAWLHGQAKKNKVGIYDMLNAVVTDARVEDAG